MSLSRVLKLKKSFVLVCLTSISIGLSIPKPVNEKFSKFVMFSIDNPFSFMNIHGIIKEFLTEKLPYFHSFSALDFHFHRRLIPEKQFQGLSMKNFSTGSNLQLANLFN